MSTKKQSVSPPTTHGRSADLALVALALIWGTSHVITKDILATHSPAFYTSWRFGVAALCFAIFLTPALRRSDRRSLWQGFGLGLCSFVGIACYTLGLVYTAASKAGFISGLYMVFTPLVGFLLFRVRPTRDHLAGVVIALSGFALLSLPQGSETINWGDGLILVASLAWATHIAATSVFARTGQVKTLAAIQVITVAVFAILTMLVLRWLAQQGAGPAWLTLELQPNPLDGRFLVELTYMALVVTFAAALLQTWAQKDISSTYAAVLYALEPVTAAVFAYLFLGEHLTTRRAGGAALIVAGVLLSRFHVATRWLGRTPQAGEDSSGVSVPTD